MSLPSTKTAGKLAAAIALSVLSACTADPTSPLASSSPLSAKGGAGSGTVYVYSLSGDLTFGNAPTATMPTGKPFANLGLVNALLVVGDAPHAVNDCAAPVSSFTDTWSANGGTYSGAWSGTFKINKFQTMGFVGSSGTATMQMSAQNKVVESGPDANGVMTIAYTNVLSFNGSSSTYFDGKHRCVSFVLTATPQ